jgi:hypothetical protein
MNKLTPETMDLISGGSPNYDSFPGLPRVPKLPRKNKEEPKDGGATGSW